MKTTLNLDDDLLRSAKDRAAARGMTLTRVVEEALRAALTEPTSTSYRLEVPVIGGRRPPTVDVNSNAALEEYLDHHDRRGPA